MSGSRIFVNGNDRVQNKLNRLADRTQDLTEAWPRVQRYIADVEDEQFSSRGARLGTPWKPLQPEYRLWKATKGHNRSPLVLTGGLRASFLGKGRWAIKDTNRKTAKFGSRHPLAHIHQSGTDGGKIPARPMLVATAELRAQIQEILDDHIRGRR